MVMSLGMLLMTQFFILFLFYFVVIVYWPDVIVPIYFILCLMVYDVK